MAVIIIPSPLEWANLIFLCNVIEFWVDFNIALIRQKIFNKTRYKLVSPCHDFPAVTSQKLSIPWTVCFGRSRPISVHRPTALHFKTMNWVRTNRKGIRPGCKPERDESTGCRHTESTYRAGCVLFLHVAKHVSESVSMCLGTSEIMWLMIQRLKL